MPKPRHSQPSRPVTKKAAAKTQAKARQAVPVQKNNKTALPAKAAPRRPSPPVVRREASRPTGKAPSRKASRAAIARTSGKSGARKSVAPVAAAGSPQKVTPVSSGPSSHDLAIETFERGFQALQQRQFGRAAEFLSALVNEYSDEKELQERARVYLIICDRQRAGSAPNPRSLEERINAATVAINRGAFADGLALLRKLQADYAENDHVQYMLCVAYTVMADYPHALEHLKQAVTLNHENRYLATQDADLDPLRREPGFWGALEIPTTRPKVAVRRR